MLQLAVSSAAAMRFPSFWPLLVLVCALLTGAVSVEAQQRYRLQPGSVFWIDGTTTVSRFTCTAQQAVGLGHVPSAGTRPPETLDAVVAVPVHAFNCGIERMNRDLYEALRAEAHPAVRFTLTRAEVLGTPTDANWLRLQAWGTLTLAGTERPVTLTAEGRQLSDGRVRLRGRHMLRMTDFGVEPPHGPLGLVRTHDQITVRFDLVAAPSD